MSTASQTPYDWVKTLPSSLLSIDEIPLIGHAAPFPWEKFAANIKKFFEIDQFTFKASDPTWRSAEQLLDGVSPDHDIMNISLTGIEGKIALAIDKRDLLALATFLLTHHPQETPLLDPEDEKAFVHFLTVTLCDQFVNLGWMKGLQPSLLPDESLPPEPHLCIDIQVETSFRTFIVRLFIDKTFQQFWKEKNTIPFSSALNPSLAQKLELPVSIEAGHVQMPFYQWKTVQPGDFLFLDGCTIDETFNSGSLLLRIYHLPYYKAQLTEGNISLTEQPSYHEIESAMPTNNNNDDDDLNFDDEEHEEHEEPEEDTDFDFGDDSDFDFSEESDTEETSTEEKTSTATATPTKTAPQPPSQTQKSPPAGKQVDVSKKAPEKSIAPQDIPLYIAVEVGRFQMTLDKMMELQAGNTLNLHVKPEDGVDLVVNGKRIGRGELLRFGDTLGVRITEIS